MAETGEEDAGARRRAERLARRRAIRRQRALAALAGVGFLAGLVTGALSGGEDPAPDQAAEAFERARESSGGLEDRVLAGQRLIAGWDGPEIPEGLRKLIARGGVAGVILFADNVTDDQATRKRIRSLQRIKRPEGATDPLLVMVDQEGGQVRRVSGAPDDSAEGLGARGELDARAQGRATGERLAQLGFNVNLAPVLDVRQAGGAIDREQRSFGTDPARVAELGIAFAEGLKEGGVVATAKHFPGIGRVRTNTDFASQTIRQPLEELRAFDEVPFERFVDSGGEMVMLSVATYPAFADRPAAFSRAVVTGELRGRLGFEGVTITDGLGAAAAQRFGTVGEVARAAAGAGNDLLLHTDWKDARDVWRLLRRELRDGEVDRDEFEESAARVLALRGRL